MISKTEYDSRQHPQPRLLAAAEACIVGFLRQRRSAELGALRRALLPSNPGLLLSALDRLIERGVLVTRPGANDVVVALADSPAGEVRR